MPIYEYKCKKCGNEFEIEQRITAESLTICPDETCKGEVFRKISKNVSLLFKGNGFYLTDYAKKHESPANKPSNGNGITNKPEDTKSSGKSESSVSEKQESSKKSEAVSA